jgi:hypothetical protein
MGLLTLLTVLLSLVAFLCRKTSTVMVPTLAAIIPSVWTGVYGFLIARRKESSPFAERILFVFIVWFATLHLASIDYNSVGMGSSASGIRTICLILGFPWSVAIVGSWAFMSRRLLELEHAHRRSKANACFRPAENGWTNMVIVVPPIAIGVAQARSEAALGILLATALPLVIGAFALLTRWPSDIRSRLGQAEFMLLHLAACALAMPACTLLSWGPLSHALGLTEGSRPINGYLLGTAVAFAVLSVRLAWVAPYQARAGASTTPSR